MTNPFKKAVLGLIVFYRCAVSPLKPYPTCRFVPTCSEYALTAITRFGLVKGGALALWRILRCNPFVKGGYDPVPDKKTDTNFFNEV